MGAEQTIDIKAKPNGKQFTITQQVLDPMGLKADDWIWLRVKDATSGKLIYEGNQRMKLGTEIYGPEFQGIIGDQALKVTVARPK